MRGLLCFLGVVCSAVLVSSVRADTPGVASRPATVCPPYGLPPVSVCPPVPGRPIPHQPGVMPGQPQPLLPGQPQPMMPGQPSPTPGQPSPTPETPQTPAPTDEPTAPTTEPSAQQAAATEAGTQPAESFNATVFGDQGPLSVANTPLIATLPNGLRVQLQPGQMLTLPAGTVLNRPVTIVQNNVDPNLPPGTQIPAGTPIPVPIDITAVAPSPVTDGPLPLGVDVLRGAFKVAENESVRPLDRIYLTYNFFSNVNPFIVPAGTPATNVHRQTLGIEKTILGGDASLGVRLPFLQVEGGFSTRNYDAIGDLTFVSKFALINDPDFVVSSGLLVTAPSGGLGQAPSIDPEVHPWVLQPWVGASRMMGSWFVQGFSSLAIPTDDRDVRYWFNDLQLGYVFRPQTTGPLSMIMPVAEVHINTPLNHRDIRIQPVGAADIVNLTGGVALGFGNRGLLNLGAVAPVTGPRPFDVEAMIQLNLYY